MLRVQTVDVVDAVRVLGVLFTPDLALDKHTSAVSAKCFYQLRQLRRVCRSLYADSTRVSDQLYRLLQRFARQRAVSLDRQASTSRQRA